MKKLSEIYQSETDEKVPAIGVPSQSTFIPFTQDEVDSLDALRNKEYDPHQKERRLMDLVELAALVAQPIRGLAKLVTRPIQGNGNRFLNYFAGTRYQPVTRTVRVDGAAMANSPAEAAEIAALAKGKTGEDVIGVKQATKKLMKPRHHLREYTSPLGPSQGDGVLREVRPVNEYWRIPVDAYKVKFDTGIDRVRPNFESMPKTAKKVLGPISTEIIMNPR